MPAKPNENIITEHVCSSPPRSATKVENHWSTHVARKKSNTTLGVTTTSVMVVGNGRGIGNTTVVQTARQP